MYTSNRRCACHVFLADLDNSRYVFKVFISTWFGRLTYSKNKQHTRTVYTLHLTKYKRMTLLAGVS